ncbi:MAG: hypothetical protein KDC98_02125 [Planctomycetes bacterium]|nr:hypothetical protein [Planctomycetota bacterium]
MKFATVARAALLGTALLLTSCGTLPLGSHPYNPIGWPAKGLQAVGFWCADTGVPLVRETGRLLHAAGELFDAPALLVEGIVTFDGGDLLGSGQHLLVGTGSTITAAWNVPFFLVPGGNVDLGRDVELVNAALAHIEQLPPQSWRFDGEDPRPFVFPKGTRARASGCNLIFSMPGHGEVLQAAEANLVWHGLQWMAGTHFPAQERSWGFVVGSCDRWDDLAPRFRAKTILHELYHQQMQMRDWLQGWTLVYWPAYMMTFPFTGWHDHWAEMGGPHDAGAVDRALSSWSG